MKKLEILAVSCTIALSLVGCNTTAISENAIENIAPAPAPFVTQEEIHPTEIASVVTQEEQKDGFVPTEEDVLSARAEALVGMTDEQIEQLNQIVKEANLWWEHNYLYLNIFEVLEDPNSLYWNLFDQTGAVQIGWTIPGTLDMATVCEEENLTEDAFYEKYCTPFIVQHEHDANDFIDILDELIATVQNEALKTDLQYIRDEAQLAKDNHSMEHANNEYKALHDLDYFLLRYGPADAGPYVDDDSTISKYYGTLSVYS